MIKVDCCWQDFPAVGRWAHVTGRPVSVWLVARCWCCRLAPKSPTDVSSSLLVHRLYPAGLSLCHGPQPASCGFRKITARPIVKPACPILRPPVASSAAPSPDLVASRRPPSFPRRPISAFSFPSGCPSSPSSQSPAYRASSIKRAPGRVQRSKQQQDSKNQHHPAIRVAPHYQIKLSMRTIRP